EVLLRFLARLDARGVPRLHLPEVEALSVRDAKVLEDGPHALAARALRQLLGHGGTPLPHAGDLMCAGLRTRLRSLPAAAFALIVVDVETAPARDELPLRRRQTHA